MADRIVALFYKRLVTLGGAEVLLSEHYAWLKANGYAAKLLCFEIADLDRIRIDADDIIEVKGQGTLAQTMALAKHLKSLNAAQVFCHSGHIEFGLAAWWAGIAHSVFLHQPTTMSFNETDKYARPYFHRYKAFARRDTMFEKLVAAHKALSWKRRLYINLRAKISQKVLHRADDIFVLSDYAVREKRDIFGLTAHYLSGGIPVERLEDLMDKTPVRTERDCATLVSVSRLDKHKRLEQLIGAIDILRSQDRKVRLIIGGAGPVGDALKTQVERLNLGSYVTFLGYVPEKDIENLYAKMDLFVTIDWADYQITTYEVLSENRRVIVSDDTEVDAMLLQSGYLYVASANEKNLAETVLTALDTPVSWDQMQLKTYLADFTWSSYFSRIDEVMSGNA